MRELVIHRDGVGVTTQLIDDDVILPVMDVTVTFKVEGLTQKEAETHLTRVFGSLYQPPNRYPMIQNMNIEVKEHTDDV